MIARTASHFPARKSQRGFISRFTFGIAALACGVAWQSSPLAADEASSLDKWQPPIPMATLQGAKTALIPFPRNVKWNAGDFVINSATKIVYPQSENLEVANAESSQLANAIALLQKVMTENGLQLAVVPIAQGAAVPPNAIEFVGATANSHVPRQQSYTITVSGNGISIHSQDDAGVFYGVETLRQMLRREADGLHVQQCAITDFPAFKLRGFMHDTGRNFQTIDSLKAQLDIFAAYKLNTFHWHLTDNPAWRVECKVFPQLNDPKFQTRDKGDIYTYAQIRDLCAYAKARCITVIPELDMPGHSAAFQRAMGFSMDSPQGIDALEKIINEFCSEIPASDCPILHIGSDEVSAKNPAQFMDRILKVVRANGRQPMVWNPGLKGDATTINQLWSEGAVAHSPAKGGAPFVDSANGYLNYYDPLITVQRYYFWQPCLRAQGDQQALGGILCLWNDVRVADKINLFRDNPVWPGLLAFADAIWDGRPSNGAQFEKELPPANSEAGQYFHEFENRLAANRDHFFAKLPFPYVKFGEIPWRLAGPFYHPPNAPGNMLFDLEKLISSGAVKAAAPSKEAWGGVIDLRDHGMVLDKKMLTRSTVYAETFIYSPLATTTHAIIGFETPARSNRRCGGIPQQGQWDAFGAQVWINDAPVPPPHWNEPGKYKYFGATWFSPANEIPFVDEQFYWLREPSQIALKAGWNKVLIRVPCGYNDQAWTFTFVPVKKDATANRWIEDDSLRFATEPSGILGR